MSSVMQLGYLVFEVSDLEAWEKFGTKVLGMEVVNERGDQGFSLRMDSYQQRFFIEAGPADDLAVIGWQVKGPAELEAIAKRLTEAGHQVVQGTPEEAARRNVQALIRFEDPAGNPGEVFYGPKMAETPFQSKVVRSGFVADEQGLGHVVVVSKNDAEHEAFYEKVFGFKLSDYIRCEYFGGGQNKRIHHFMVQAKSMDEVGMCYDRFLFSGGMVHQTLGRHPNDKMFSFYGYTPSGFHFEFGYGGIEVDDASWEPTTHGKVSEWGHHPPQLLTKAYRKAKEAGKG